MILKALDEIEFSSRKLNIKVDKMFDILEFIRVRMDAPKIDSFYDLSQVCRLLGVSKRTVQRFRTEGKLKYFVISGRTHYPKTDTDAFVEKYRTGKFIK